MNKQQIVIQMCLCNLLNWAAKKRKLLKMLLIFL